MLLLYRNQKSSLVLFALLFFIFCTLSPSYSQRNNRNSKKELESKKKKLTEEIKEINAMLNETRVIRKTTFGALVKINIRLEKRQDLIRIINAQIAELTEDIKSNEAESDRLKNNLAKLKKEYAKMVVYAQRNQDAYSTLSFIFAAESFNQAYSRLKYMQQYSEFRKKQALEITNTQALILAKLQELKTQRDEKNILLGNQVEEKKILDSEKQEQEEVLTELQKKEKNLKGELERKKQAAIQLQVAIRRVIEAEIKRKAEEANRAELAKLIAAKKAEKDKNKTLPPDNKESPTSKLPDKKENATVPPLTQEAEALSADFSNNRGKLPWPVAKGIICETYGEHEHPAIKGFMMFNNGVEICATKGTQARAVFDGEVTGIALSPTGGKLVIVRHGEYLSVYTNLTDVLVKTGQKVTVKQIIGTIIYNEEEEKTTLNFQVWKGQKTMDPGGWLFNGR
jgi:murein hydrolase activator